VNRVLGMDIPETDIRRILTGLGLQIADGNPLQVIVPTFRPDLKNEIDLIEEIIRHFGYDRIEPKTVSLQPLEVQSNKEQEFTERIRDIFVGMGLLEAWNNSLVPKKHTDLFFEKTVPVAIRNPLSPETAFLRTALLPGLLESIRWNLNRSTTDLRMFEIGKVFSANAKSLPDEHLWVAGVIIESSKTRGYWKGKSPKIDFYALKGVIQAFLQKLHVSDVTFQSRPIRGWILETSLVLTAQDKPLGTAGEIDPALLTEFDIAEKAYGFELHVGALLAVAPESCLYQPIPKFPPVRRDMAVVVDENVQAGAVQKIIQQSGGALLHSVELFDLYQGQQIPVGKKSFAFALSFLSLERTLKEDEIDPVFQQIVQALQKEFSASLRTQ
jgi:phenylalanyl-tRNA synthetase beta chain